MGFFLLDTIFLNCSCFSSFLSLVISILINHFVKIGDRITAKLIEQKTFLQKYESCFPLVEYQQGAVEPRTNGIIEISNETLGKNLMKNNKRKAVWRITSIIAGT